MVAFPVDWGNVSVFAQNEVLTSRNPQPQQHARRYSESGATFTPSFPSLDNAPEPISYSGMRRRSLACSSDWDNDHFSTLLTTIANNNPSDESSLFSDASDPSKCSQGSRSPRGSRRRFPANPSVEASHHRSSKQGNRAYRRPSSREGCYSCAGGEQEWYSGTDTTEQAWPVDQSVSSSAESTATDSSTSAVLRQKREANRRLSNSSFGENGKGSQHSGSDAAAEWSRRIWPTSASEVHGLKKEFQVRRSSTTNSTEDHRHRRASSLSRKTARRSSTGNSIDQQQGWPTTDFAEDEDSQADHYGQDDSKGGSLGIKAGSMNIKKYEKASRKDATDGEDRKYRQSSKSKTNRSSSRSRPPKPASKDHIEEKKEEQVSRSERKLRRSSLRGDKGSSSSRDESENTQTGAGPSDTTERDHAAMVFPCVTPMGRKPMLSMKLGRRDD